MKTLNSLFSAAALLLVFASCQKEPASIVSNKTIKARIVTESPETKSSSESRFGSLIGTLKANDIQLDVFESEGIAASSPITRSSVITTDSFNSAKVDAYLGQAVESQPQHYINGGKIEKTGDVKQSNGDACYWLNEIDMHMWCYLPESLNMDMSTSNGSATFNYTVPTNQADQKDIIVSYNVANHKEGEDDQMDVTLYHAMAAINFDIRLIPAGSKITKVEIVDAYGTGTCVFQPSQAKKEDKFAWTPSEKATFSKEYSTGIAGTDGGIIPTLEDGVFFMMPQTLPEGAKIRLTFDKGDGTEPVVGEVAAAGHTYKAGYTYTYRVSAFFTTSDNVDTGDNGWIKFEKTGYKYAKYKSLDLPKKTHLVLKWDFEVGNSKKEVNILIKQSPRDDVAEDKLKSIPIYTREANKVGANYSNDNLSEPAIRIETTNVKGNNPCTGTSALHFYLDSDMIGFVGPYDIVFDYDGNNNGTAHWYISNISLAIVNE